MHVGFLRMEPTERKVNLKERERETEKKVKGGQRKGNRDGKILMTFY